MILRPKRELILPRSLRKQRGYIINPYAFGAGGAPAAKVLAYETFVASSVNSSSYTFSSEDIGTAAADRRVHVLCFAGSTGGDITLASCTIGGIAATINVNIANSGRSIALATALVPTGATADIVITWSGTGSGVRCGAGIWSSTGLLSEVAIDSATSTADPATATITSLAGGFCISGATQGSATGTVSWTNVTEKFDSIIESNQPMSGASDATAGTSISPSANYSDAGTSRVWCAATF